MTRVLIATAALGAMLLSAPPVPSSADTLFVAQYRFETKLIVQVMPLAAQIIVDGRVLGTAQDLVAEAISVTPGPHTIQVSAPGFVPYVGTFVADPFSSVSQFRVTLAPR